MTTNPTTPTTAANVRLAQPSRPLITAKGWAWIGLFAGLFVALHLEFLRRMWIVATTDNNWSHALVVPVISAYYLYLHRYRLAQTPKRLCWWGLPILFAGMLSYAWWIYPGQNDMFRGYSMIVSLFGLTLLLLGPAMMKLLWFPIAYLGFGVQISESIWQRIAWQLQQIAAHGATVVLKFLAAVMNFDVQQKGTQLWLTFSQVVDGNPQTVTKPLNVAEACSGLRMLMAFVALGAALAFLFDRAWWQRVVMIVMAVPIAIAVNIGRVAVIGILFQFDQDKATGAFHIFIGMLMLIPAALLFLAVAWILDHLFISEDHSSEGSDGPDHRPSAASRAQANQGKPEQPEAKHKTPNPADRRSAKVGANPAEAPHDEGENDRDHRRVHEPSAQPTQPATPSEPGKTGSTAQTAGQGPRGEPKSQSTTNPGQGPSNVGGSNARELGPGIVWAGRGPSNGGGSNVGGLSRGGANRSGSNHGGSGSSTRGGGAEPIEPMGQTPVDKAAIGRGAVLGGALALLLGLIYLQALNLPAAEPVVPWLTGAVGTALLIVLGLALVGVIFLIARVVPARGAGRFIQRRNFGCGLAAAVLGVSLITQIALVQTAGAVLVKHAVPLQKELILMPTDHIGPWKVVKQAAPLPPAQEEELGTKKYITWYYLDTSMADPDQVDVNRGEFPPGSVARVHVAYYTGNPDTVPHVPDRCFIAGGAEGLDVSTTRLNVGGPRYVPNQSGSGYHVDLGDQRRSVRVPSKNFDATSFTYRAGQGRGGLGHVIYFFAANGQFLPSPNLVRLQGFDLTDKYSYYCKVEVQFLGLTDGQRAKQRTEALLNNLLPEVMACLPDWYKLTHEQ